MKKLIALLALLCTSIAFGATTVPVQLLNPTGSTAGQAIVSTGPTTAPAWGGVPVGGLAAIAANSVIANATNASTVPTAVTVTGCNGAAQALQWTNGTGFGCNSAIATSGANSNITGLSGLTSPVALPGVTNGSNAAAGSVGEYVTTTGSVALTAGAPANVLSISLTAGDWDVQGDVRFFAAATTTATSFISSWSTTSATHGTIGRITALATTFGAGASPMWDGVTPNSRLSISTTTTVFLVATANFATSTMTASGWIQARRVR